MLTGVNRKTSFQFSEATSKSIPTYSLPKSGATILTRFPIVKGEIPGIVRNFRPPASAYASRFIAPRQMQYQRPG